MRTLLTIALVGCSPEPVEPGTDGGVDPTTTGGGTGDGGGPDTTATVTLNLTPVWTVQMRDIDGVGDVNGDGFDDVVVRTWYTTGIAELYLGSATGFGADPAWRDERSRSDELGLPARAGDVNGDGFGDVLFAAGSYDAGAGFGPGRVTAFYGSASGLAPAPDWAAFGEPGERHFGTALSAAGDVNNDGYDDIVVSALDYDDGTGDQGKVYLFLGSPVGLEETASWTVESNSAHAWFGTSVAGAGDMNGDGFDDVVVGAPYPWVDAVSGGRAYLYPGGASGLAARPAWSGHGDESLSQLTEYGASVRGAGDVNGDGFDDLLVGAPQTTRPDGGQGVAHVVLGSARGPIVTNAWLAESHQEGSAYGSSVSGGGDLNGDGYDDVAIGAYLYDDISVDEGRVEVYLGSPSGLRPESAWSNGSRETFGWYSTALGAGGDVNGDGFDDLVVGAAGYVNEDLTLGRVWAYAGSDTTE